MVLSLVPALVGIAITVVLAVAAVAAGAFTAWAGFTAAFFGSVIVVLAGWPFFALLILFVIASTLATRYGFEEKQRRNVHEGTRGERGVSNVLAHILVPVGLVLASAAEPVAFPPSSLAVVYTSALAFGAADTFASEFGVLSGQARSILTGRPVPAGTNGGVSAVGELWAAAGALSVGILALVFLLAAGAPLPTTGLLVGGASTAGFLGCQVDSVIGETLENRGLLSKGSTNFLAMLASVAIGFLLLLLVHAEF